MTIAPPVIIRESATETAVTRRNYPLDVATYPDARSPVTEVPVGSAEPEPDWDRFPERIDDAARRRPIGIAPHGALAERLHRQNRLEVLTGLLRRIRDRGVLVGLSAHNPALIRLAEERNWDVDYYMCCLYYLTRPREEFQRLLGQDLPLGEIYLPSDPGRMFEVVRAVRKPCLVYKVLAAGRRVGGKDEVKACFKAALDNIKPTDALIVGMYQQFGDQVGENAAIVRELCARKR